MTLEDVQGLIICVGWLGWGGASLVMLVDSYG
jgi:hypothetical protein